MQVAIHETIIPMPIPETVDQKSALISSTPKWFEGMMRPGTITSLFEFDPEIFYAIWRHTIRNAIDEVKSNIKKENNAYCKLVCQILREFNFNSEMLKIVPENKKNTGLSSKQINSYFGSNWSNLTYIFEMGFLNDDDWLSMFTTFANAIKGKERNCGHGLFFAEQSLKKPLLCPNLIDSHPRIFAGNNGSNVMDSFYGILARGHFLQDMQLFREKSNFDESWIKEHLKLILSTLIKKKIKMKDEALVGAAVTGCRYKKERIVILESFEEIFGKPRILNARNNFDGSNALHYASDLTSYPYSFETINNLIDYGFDCTEVTKDNKTPLELAVTQPLANKNCVLTLLNHTKNDEVLNKLISDCSPIKLQIPDPSILALLQAESAKRSISNTLTKNPTFSESKNQKNIRITP